jgi:uncharacterized membrane protein
VYTARGTYPLPKALRQAIALPIPAMRADCSMLFVIHGKCGLISALGKGRTMAHAENSITIDQPVATVFAFILDGTNGPLWRPTVLDVARVPGTPDGVGARYKQGLKGPGGRRIDGDYEITECEPNSLIRFQVTAGPARPTGTYRFAAAGDATRITFALDYQPRGLAKLMDPVIEHTMRSEVAMLTNLKAYLEEHA